MPSIRSAAAWPRLLCERGVTAVALVDDWAQVARLARLPVRMIQGRVADRGALGGAMAGCDAVFHCAEYDQPPRGAGGWRGALRSVWGAFAVSRRNLEGVEAVLSVAVQSGIRTGDLPQRGGRPHHAPREPPCATIMSADLSVTVLRPATLYGPFCPWTIDAVRALRRGRRPRGGRGPVSTWTIWWKP